jgi:hypothetical protein
MGVGIYYFYHGFGLKAFEGRHIRIFFKTFITVHLISQPTSNYKCILDCLVSYYLHGGPYVYIVFTTGRPLCHVPYVYIVFTTGRPLCQLFNPRLRSG